METRFAAQERARPGRSSKQALGLLPLRCAPGQQVSPEGPSGVRGWDTMSSGGSSLTHLHTPLWPEQPPPWSETAQGPGRWGEGLHIRGSEVRNKSC